LVGYELTDSSGVVIAEAEMVWEELRIAYLLSHQEGGKSFFLKNDWIVLTSEENIAPELFNRRMN
jgi:hypothetical protein